MRNINNCENSAFVLYKSDSLHILLYYTVTVMLIHIQMIIAMHSKNILHIKSLITQ